MRTSYPLAREVTEGQMNSLSIKPDKFHGEWELSIPSKILKWIGYFGEPP